MWSPSLAWVGRFLRIFGQRLEIRDRACVVPGCNKRVGLEIDHYRVAFADGGETKLENLARICRFHHYLKTHAGYRLTGAPGAWRWLTPTELEGEPAGRGPASDL